MAVKYTYVPVPPGSSDIVYCDVYRMFDGNGVTMEHVGRFRGNEKTSEIVDLLNETRDSSPSSIYSTKKALNIATRVCAVLGIDYANTDAAAVVEQLVKSLK